MKSRKYLRAATILCGVRSVLSLGFYFLALHDIADDYVNPKIAADRGISLPEWTRCPREWSTLNYGFLPIFGFHALVITTFFMDGHSRPPGQRNGMPENTRVSHAPHV